MVWTSLSPEFAVFQDLGKEALSCWAPKAKFELKPLSGGRSGAAVFRIDVTPSRPEDELNGKYILKLSSLPKYDDQICESDAHRKAFDYAENFAKQHIPNLLDSYPRAGDSRSSNALGYAMLYEIGGGSLDSYHTAALKDNSGLLAIAEKLSAELLHA